MEPSPEVWVHGLLPWHANDQVNEKALLKLVEEQAKAVASTDHKIGMEQWTALVAGLGLSTPQAAACMRLCFALTQPFGAALPMPADDALRLPLGSLLLLLWVQWAHHELGEGCGTSVHRAQAASGEVWPSLLQPPAAAASSLLSDGGCKPCARTLAVQSRLHNVQSARRRRRLLQGSLPALLQLAGGGAERLYAADLDLLSLLLRPDPAAAARLSARGERPESLAAAVGVWADQPTKSMPMATLLAALRAALVEVPTAAAHPPAAKSLASAPSAATTSRSPLATASAPAQNVSAAAANGTTPTPFTPATPAPILPPRPTVSTSDREEDEDGERAAHHGTLAASAEGVSAPGGGVLRLQGAKRRTVVLREKDVKGGAVQMIDCHGCYVYVLAPVRAAELLGCTGCTVVLGAVSHVLSASHCDKTKLVATAKAARLSNLHDVTVCLCVNSPPLVGGENHRLSLAPFATVYTALASHMAVCHLSAALSKNFWDQPVSAKAEPTYALLPPVRFTPFHIPTDVPASTTRGAGVAPVCELPAAYASALCAHVERMARFGDELKQLSCPEEVRREVQATVHAGFREWLVRTGNLRQVSDLLAQQTW